MVDNVVLESVDLLSWIHIVHFKILVDVTSAEDSVYMFRVYCHMDFNAFLPNQ